MTLRARRGVLMKTLFEILIVLLVLGVVLFVFVRPTSEAGKTFQQVSGCSEIIGGVAQEGRCFADRTCGGKPGWSPIAKITCPQALPYCCRLEDIDAYYGYGTALLEFQTGTSFRFAKSSSGDSNLLPEATAESVDNYLQKTNGLPSTEAFSIRYKAREGETECRLTLKAGGVTKAYDAVACSSAGFADLMVEQGQASQRSFVGLRREPTLLKCAQEGNSCRVGVTISAKGEGERSESYTLYFSSKTR